MNQPTESDEILNDGKIKFKIHSAKSFLENIPESVPLQVDSEDRIKVEIDIQCFLFFSVGALDICYQNVNEKLFLGILPHKFSFPKFQEKLNEKVIVGVSKAKLILDDLEKYTKEPTYEIRQSTQDYVDQYANEHFDGNRGLEFWSRFEHNSDWFEHIWKRKNSSLWELRKLRNLITHGSILKQSREQSNSYARDGLGVPLNHEMRSFRDQYFVLNPKQYFQNSFRDVKMHINEIVVILEN